jgi:serine/threonine protein phosphatase 1
LAWPLLVSVKSRALPSIPPGERIYAVGDVHGRADLLSELFSKIDADLNARPAAKSVQIFLGDYIDRGPQSREVIDLLIERRRKHNVIYLKGNHEDCVLRFLCNPTALPAWRRIGGISTLMSYDAVPSREDSPQSHRDAADAFAVALPKSHLSFFKSLALSYTRGDFFFAHAGVRPGVSLSLQSQTDLLWIRDDFLLHEEDFGKIVVHGHTPVHEPDIRSNRINLDTGAYATGRLTCLVLEGDERIFI